ncbi:hypothetical protein OXPF_15060 [Oxobacter pfennigii]|uniref:DUF6870 domain-containing protein n=1 Tax=Oxobacter pfennigii TaxID=36849 RepID=A0A0P8WBD5_9CLOT|nr:hypothetical protein [Oxobacter pfennigii]KPU45028.1 hypothetical protein OXPF_15060 [Oxobacter pfennigii]
MKDMLDSLNIQPPEHVNLAELADIRDVKIDLSLPKEERVKSYLVQIKNPYCYRYGDIIVRVSFADTEASLEDRLKQYLLSHAGSALS